MLSPPIPLKVLLELRRLLDTMQATEAKCEQNAPASRGCPNAIASPVSRSPARRQFPQTDKSKNALPIFQQHTEV